MGARLSDQIAVGRHDGPMSGGPKASLSRISGGKCGIPVRDVRPGVGGPQFALSLRTQVTHQSAKENVMMPHTLRQLLRLACCLAVIGSYVGSQTTALAATVVSSFQSKGAYASFSGQYDACMWVYVSVSRGGPVGTQETYLYYSAYNACTGES